ncbi:hypothetical protein V2647_06860 [Tenacibaculum maritimum]|uniref:hypothetical protein n=1 Tax=Tenacibaculum maritimum TaxID=107401 RepID=UPI003876776F
MADKKQEALEKLSKLPEKALVRIASLSDNPKALKYFTCPLKFGLINGFLSK